MTTVVNIADHQPEPVAALRILIAPGDPTGYPITHPHIDGLWQPVLGPSAVSLLRLVDRFAATYPVSFTIELDHLGRRLGIGGRGATSRAARTIDRLCNYRVAARLGANELVVPLRLPALRNRQLDRLPPYIAMLDQELRVPAPRSV